MKTEFLNEHIIPGNAGHFLVLLAFVSSLLAFVSYLISSRSRLAYNAQSWKKLGNYAFVIHGLSILGVFGILFYLIFNHYFEYNYVWKHSGKTLPFKYLLSCFWEGQEGSFLLWLIWHVVLAFIFLKKQNKWTAPVMTFVSLTQAFLTFTLIGLYVGDWQFGSSPFVLLRDVMSNAPVFQQPDYLSKIQDGNGLNPLLQNYWMVIHPPVLFLGFALTLFPFSFSLAALWKKDYDDFVKPTIKWTLWASMVLGAGIMMGGMWAYESLTFGGYWAWDPVENSSLVPWLTLIAGLHTLIIYKSTGYSLRATFGFLVFSFLLTLYSTFLTRTGILGDTSVHSFTGEGSWLSFFLVLFIASFLLTSFYFIFRDFRNIPNIKKEEELLSREFWMFLGSLVLLISLFHIAFTTSLPVFNSVFGSEWAISKPIDHYNRIQIWLAVLVVLGTALIYYLKFKKTDWRAFIRAIRMPVIFSIAVSICIIYFQKLYSAPIMILLFASLLGVSGNLYYILRFARRHLLSWGGNIAHIGFALMLIGILLSSYNKEVISKNELGIDFDMGKENPEENQKESRENILLFRGVPVTMAEYEVTYMGDTIVEPNHYYKVLYQRKSPEDSSRILEEFILKPNAQINPKMGLVSSPDSRHYWNRDIFTYITSTLDKSKTKDTSSYETAWVREGDSIFFSNGAMIFKKIDGQIRNKNYKAQKGDIAVAAHLDVLDLKGNQFKIDPVYAIRDQMEIIVPDSLLMMNLEVKISKILPREQKIQIEYRQPDVLRDYVIMKALKFPYINVLWIGTGIMIFGFALSILKRITRK